jgi:hypothetical protein
MERVAHITTLREQANDLPYWLGRPVQERLAALEQLRQQWTNQLPHAEQRLQRVHHLTQLHRR